MAAHLTDKQKKQIIADYVELGSYNAVARKHGVSVTTVIRTCGKSDETKQKVIEKKQENTDDILAYMEMKKQIVCEIIGKGLDVLNDEEKLKSATPAQITTAIGTLIDKFTNSGASGGDVEDLTPLAEMLRRK